MARYAYGGKSTVESIRAIEVSQWHRLGYFTAPRPFSWVWTRDDEQTASIRVVTDRHQARLQYRYRSFGDDWTDVEQRIPIDWSPCRFGGERPWFVCSVASNGVYCGRRVTKLYGAGRLFACRHCYGLAYTSKQESAHHRGLWKSQKIRMQLGGSPSMLDEFPYKPKGMHWRTYQRLRRLHDAADARSTIGLMGFLQRLAR